MNEEMPWVNLTQEEVDELREKKYELTEYGKEKLKKLMAKDQLENIARLLNGKISHYVCSTLTSSHEKYVIEFNHQKKLK
jgi:DNA-binding PadR family transcriptional regulator